jgi:hypothetical protein
VLSEALIIQEHPANIGFVCSEGLLAVKDGKVVGCSALG